MTEVTNSWDYREVPLNGSVLLRCMRVLDGDQLHVRHGDGVAEVSGVVERVPVAYLYRGDADRHGVLFMDARSLQQCEPYCVNLRQL